MIARAARIKGGITPALLKAFRVLREEGFNGIAQRLEKARNYGLDSSSDRGAYLEWISKYDESSDSTPHTHAGSLLATPGVSVVIATSNPDPILFSATLDSVLEQSSPNWELCIADDASTDSNFQQLLRVYADRDPRIRVSSHSKQRGLIPTLNHALSIARYEWVTALEANDLLAKTAIERIGHSAENCPQSQIIYTDEDRVDENGNRHSPYFKPSWNQDLFYSQDFVSHLCAYRKKLIMTAGGFKEGFEGAYAYDLILRCLNHVRPYEITHIPKVLYHRRDQRRGAEHHAKSEQNEDPAARALAAHLSDIGISATPVPTEYGLRVKYKLPEKAPLVSLIIPTRNGLNLLRQCIDSVVTRTLYPRYEFIIIDNGSDDPATLDYINSLSKQSLFTIIRAPGPFNYSALNNRAVDAANGELVCLLNNDIEVISHNWLDEMVSHALRPEIGAVGAKLLYADNTIQHAGVILGIRGCAGHAHRGFPKDSPGYFGRANLISNYSAVTAACLLVRKSLFLEVGGLNERDLPVAFNDVDLCLKIANAGYRNLWTPYAELYHHESATRGEDTSPTQKARLAAEEKYMGIHWGEQIKNDPAYNPNLTIEHENFSLAYPPRCPES